MCTGLEVAGISAALSAAGSASQGYAQSQALSKQNDIAAAGIIKQGELQKQAENDVSQVTNKTVAQSNADTAAQTAKQLAAYHAALQQSSGISNSASQDVPGASKAYKAAQTQASGSAANYVNALADSAATTEGTQLERVNEGQQIAGTAGQLGLLNQQSNEQSYLTKLQINATKANPWLVGFGQLAQGLGAVGGGLAGSMAGDAASVAARSAAAVGIGGSIASDATGATKNGYLQMPNSGGGATPFS
jgi:hypothetical protein